MSQSPCCLRHPSGSRNATLFQLGRRHRATAGRGSPPRSTGISRKQNARLLSQVAAHLHRNVTPVLCMWRPAGIKLKSKH